MLGNINQIGGRGGGGALINKKCPSQFSIPVDLGQKSSPPVSYPSGSEALKTLNTVSYPNCRYMYIVNLTEKILSMNH